MPVFLTSRWLPTQMEASLRRLRSPSSASLAAFQPGGHTDAASRVLFVGGAGGQTKIVRACVVSQILFRDLSLERRCRLL